jgi:hypothetical protein
LRRIEPLWVTGLAVLCLLFGHVVFRSPWLHLQGKTYDWAQYAVAGVLFPALLFGLPLLWRWRSWSTTWATLARQLLALGCLIAFAVFLAASMAKYGPGNVILPAALAVLQTLIMTRPWRRPAIDPARLAVIFVVAFVAWTVTLSFDLIELVQPPIFLIGFAVAFLLASDAARDPETASRLGLAMPSVPSNLATLVIIAFMSLRTEHLFEVLGERGALHHWGAWVGAADLVREGGWLLWDAPSNYGSLNVLAFAVLPTATPWQGLYLLQALAFFVVSGGIFLILRALRPGVLNWVFALAMAIAIPMYMQADNPAGPVTSTFILPSWGPYRYVWAFVLVVILIWERVTEERSRRHAWVLITGCLAWVIGVLWSPESAFFCSGTWLPAYVAIVLRMTARGPHRWRRMVSWLALPPVMLCAALGTVGAVFIVRLGHLPDWESYLDYARYIGVNVLVVIQEPIGPALGMLLGFCVLAMGAVYAGMRMGWPTRSIGLWVGLLGAYWATNSFGYQRGYHALHPVAYAVLGVLLVLLARRSWPGNWESLARAGTVPLLALMLTSPLAAVAANPLAIGEAAASLTETARHRFEVEYLLPDADPELQALMAEAGVQADDPIFYAADWLGNLLLPWRPDGAIEGERVITGRHWTPGHPVLALRWIPEGRGAVYTSRYIERAPMSGWLIQGKTGIGASVDFNAYAGGLEPWFFDVAQQTHVPTRIYESANWQLVWFEFVGDKPEVARPDYGWSRLGPLPPDVLVDGKPLSESAHPEVWAVFGEGWGLFDPALGNRAANARAAVWVYSPETHEGLFRVTPSSVGDGNLLKVTVAGDPATAQPVPFRPGKTAEAPITLQPGWNLITLKVQSQPSKSDTGASAREGKTDRDKGERKARREGAEGTAIGDESGSAEAIEDAEEPWMGFFLERLEIVTEPVA